MSNKKDNWELKPLGEVTECLDSKRIPVTKNQREEGDVPYYGTNGIQGYVKDFIFDEELLLVAEDGGSWGKNQRCANIIQGKSWVNNHAHVLRMKDTILIKFLEVFLNMSDLTKYINGTTRGKLNQKELNSIMVPVPSIAVQKEIVAILERAEKLKEKRENANERTKEVLQALFYDMFGDPIKNEKGFQIKELNEITDVRDGTHDSPKYVTEGYPLVTSKNVTNGYIDFSTAKLISKEDFISVNKRSFVDDGDIIMPMIGTIGNPVVVHKDREFAVKNVALIKFHKSKMSNVYIQQLLSSNYFDEITKNANRGGTQKFIALKDIRAIPVPVPSEQEQIKFEKYYLFVKNVMKKQDESTKQIDSLFDALMQKAFNGELVGA